MRSLKVPLIVLLVFIAIVFNIEALSIGSDYIFVLHPFVDILILLIVVAALSVRALSKLHAYANAAFWVIVYFGVWFQASKSANLQNNLVVTLVEVTFIAVTALLSREVAVRLFEVENTLDKLVFASFRGRTQSMQDAAEEIKTELLRSRRYQRSLTVMVVEPDPASIQKSMLATVEEIQHNLARRYSLGKISEVISSTARRPDLVLKEDQNDRFVLVCPETTAESSEVLRQRLQAAVKSSLGVSMSVGVASFPQDALTFEELLHKASSKILPPAGSGLPVTQTDEVDSHKI